MAPVLIGVATGDPRMGPQFWLGSEVGFAQIRWEILAVDSMAKENPWNCEELLDELFFSSTTFLPENVDGPPPLFINPGYATASSNVQIDGTRNQSAKDQIIRRIRQSEKQLSYKMNRQLMNSN